MAERPANWAGNVTFSARALHRPTSVEQVQELVAGSDRVRARAPGTGPPVADTEGELVSVAGLALRTLGSLPHISVAGARATGTHGSGTHGSGDRCGTRPRRCRRSSWSRPTARWSGWTAGSRTSPARCSRSAAGASSPR